MHRLEIYFARALENGFFSRFVRFEIWRDTNDILSIPRRTIQSEYTTLCGECI